MKPCSVFHLNICGSQLCAVSSHCTSFFSHGVSSTAREDGKFISESCEVFAFGSNSSSQLAMGSTEKFHKATLMQHMANVQVVCIYMHVYYFGDLQNYDCKCKLIHFHFLCYVPL